MSATAETAAESAPAPSLLSSRLGSVLAFVPLAVWVPWHLYQNLSAFQGAPAWQAAVASERGPVVEVLTSTVILLPIILHTAWGVRRIRMASYNNGAYGFFDNLKFLLQRLSALGLLLFLCAHVYLARINPMLAHGRHEVFADFAHEMRHNGPTLPVYVLGVLAIAYHLGNGLYTGALTWGLAATEKARRVMAGVSYGFFALLMVLGYGSIFAVWRAGDAPVQTPVETNSIELRTP